MEIVKLADPPFNCCNMSVPCGPSTLNNTLPPGIPAAELTVTVTLPSVPYCTAGALIVVVVVVIIVVTLKMPLMPPMVSTAFVKVPKFADDVSRTVTA